MVLKGSQAPPLYSTKKGGCIEMPFPPNIGSVVFVRLAVLVHLSHKTTDGPPSGVPNYMYFIVQYGVPWGANKLETHGSLTGGASSDAPLLGPCGPRSAPGAGGRLPPPGDGGHLTDFVPN